MANISIIITVLNEEQNISRLLHSIEQQTLQPNEVVIIDGGSTDNTLSILQQWRPKFHVIVGQKKGNRSIGRNEAIRQTKNTFIAITDAGCRLDKDWLKQITEPFQDKNIDVVSGYYASDAHTSFEHAATAYMLVMPNRVGKEFLPATRSMAIRKAIWKKAGGFPQQYSHNEDYIFARRLKKFGAGMTFQRDAIVYWTPPKTWKQFLWQIYRFAVGDMESGMIRPKVISIFLRYITFIFLFWVNSLVFFLAFVAYLYWAVRKNKQHVPGLSAWYILPMMQVATDIAVMFGSIIGLKKRLLERKP